MIGKELQERRYQRTFRCIQTSISSSRTTSNNPTVYRTCQRRRDPEPLLPEPKAYRQHQRGASLTLLDAGRTSNASQLRRLLKDPNINLKQEDDEGRAALRLAVFACNKPITKLLVYAGAALDAQDYTGATPAHHAVLEGLLYYVLLVKDRGRNALNVPSDNGNVPFHLACKDGRLVMVYILLRLRGD